MCATPIWNVKEFLLYNEMFHKKMWRKKIFDQFLIAWNFNGIFGG